MNVFKNKKDYSVEHCSLFTYKIIYMDFSLNLVLHKSFEIQNMQV